MLEIQRLGVAKSAENLEFQRYLAARHQPIEAFQTVAREVQRHIDCTACANCCRYSIVSLRAAEVARIAGYLGLNDEAAMQHFTARRRFTTRANPAERQTRLRFP